jgi:S-(hydroxymethyl)glutathione dehydrogenase/alcohol dehydrogenase
MKTKAAILHTIGEPLDVVDVDIPSLKEGQYLVVILYTSICGSQKNEIAGRKGEDKYLPHLLGHEAVGRVIDKHVSCKKIDVGENVVCSWIRGEGLEGGPVKYGKYNAGPIATFVEHAIISENRLYPIHRDVNPRDSMLGCSLPTALSAICKIDPYVDILVVGAGAVGLSILIELGSIGRQKRYVKEQHFSRYSTALKYALPYKGEKVDLVFDCTGSINSLNMTMDYLKENGILVVVGNPPRGQDMKVDPYDLVFGKQIMGHRGDDQEYLTMNVFMDNYGYLDHAYDFEPLERFDDVLDPKIFNLEDINLALNSTRKPVITCQ